MAGEMKILDGAVRVRAEHVPDNYPKAKVKTDRDRTPGRTTGQAVTERLAEAMTTPGADVAGITAERDAALARAEAAEAALAEATKAAK